jgi:hypothetical protein
VRSFCNGGGASPTIREHTLAKGNEISAGGSQWPHLIERACKSDAGYLEQLRPPGDSF